MAEPQLSFNNQELKMLHDERQGPSGISFSKFKCRLQNVFTEVRALRDKEAAAHEEVQLFMEKRKTLELELGKKIAWLQAELLSSNESCQKFESIIAELQHKLSFLAMKHQDLKLEKKFMVESRNNLAEDLKISNYKLECSLKDRESELMIVKEKLSIQSMLFEAVESEASRVKTAVAETTDIINLKEDEVSTLQKNLGQISKFEHRFVEKICALENKLDAALATISAKDESIMLLKEKLEAVQNDNEHERQLSLLQNTLSVKEETLTKSVLEKEMLLSEIQDLGAVLIKLQEAISQQDKRNEENEQQTLTLQKRLDSLHEKWKENEDKLAASANERDQLMQQYRQEKESFEGQRTTWINEKISYEEELCNLRSTLDSLEALQQKVATIHHATSTVQSQEVQEEENITQMLQSGPLQKDVIQFLDTNMLEQESSMFQSEINSKNASNIVSIDRKEEICNKFNKDMVLEKELDHTRRSSAEVLESSSPHLLYACAMNAAISCEEHVCLGANMYKSDKVSDGVDGITYEHDQYYRPDGQYQEDSKKSQVSMEIKVLSINPGHVLPEYPCTSSSSFNSAEVEHKGTDLDLATQSCTLEGNAQGGVREAGCLQDASLTVQASTSEQAYSAPDSLDLCEKSYTVKQHEIQTGQMKTANSESEEDILFPAAGYDVRDQDNMKITAEAPNLSNSECFNEINVLQEKMEDGRTDNSEIPYKETKATNVEAETIPCVNSEPNIASTSKKTHSILLRLERPISSLNAHKQVPTSKHTESNFLSSLLVLPNEQEAVKFAPNIVKNVAPDTNMDKRLLEQLYPDIVDLHMEDCKKNATTESSTVALSLPSDPSSLSLVIRENSTIDLGCENSNVTESCVGLTEPSFQDCERSIELGKGPVLNLETCQHQEAQVSDETEKLGSISKGDQHIHENHLYSFKESPVLCPRRVDVQTDTPSIGDLVNCNLLLVTTNTVAENNLCTDADKCHFDATDTNFLFCPNNDINNENRPLHELRRSTASSTLSLIESSCRSAIMSSAASFKRKSLVSPSMQKRCICEQPPYGYMIKCRFCKYEYHAACVLFDDNESGDNYVCEKCKCLPNLKRRQRTWLQKVEEHLS